MIVLRATAPRPRCGLPTRRIAKASIPRSIWKSFAARCRPMPMRDSISSMKMVASNTAACWAHVRRHFYDLEQAHSSPVAREALQRIGALYGIEEPIRGRPPDERRAVRQAQAKPLLDSLRQWFEATLSKLSRKSETTVAIRYALSRWDALTRYIEDGHIEIDNNAAERSLRGVALGRNYAQSAIMGSPQAT